MSGQALFGSRHFLGATSSREFEGISADELSSGPKKQLATKSVR